MRLELPRRLEPTRDSITTRGLRDLDRLASPTIVTTEIPQGVGVEKPLRLSRLPQCIGPGAVTMVVQCGPAARLVGPLPDLMSRFLPKVTLGVRRTTAPPGTHKSPIGI